MKFVKGNKNQPSGNLLIFCHVIGQNPIAQDARIIAANIFVSFLTKDDNLPAITFPPVAFKDEVEFNAFASRHPEYDVVQIDTFQFPPDPEKAQEYVNERLQKVNDLVKEYVEFCGAFLLNQPVEAEPEELTDVLEKIRYIEQVAEEAIDEPEKLQEKNRYETFLKFFDLFVKVHPQYPIHNRVNYMHRKDDESRKLVSLFIQQSKAIYFEDYEEAKNLQNEIADLSGKL